MGSFVYGRDHFSRPLGLVGGGCYYLEATRKGNVKELGRLEMREEVLLGEKLALGLAGWVVGWCGVCGVGG